MTDNNVIGQLSPICSLATDFLCAKNCVDQNTGIVWTCVYFSHDLSQLYRAFTVPQSNENPAIKVVKLPGHQEQTQWFWVLVSNGFQCGLGKSHILISTKWGK